jgi:6-phosphogluconolactonase
MSTKPIYVGTWSPYLYILDLNTINGKISLRKSINVGNSPSWVTLNPSRTYLFTVNETESFQNVKDTGGILSYQIEKSTGELTHVNSAQSHGGAPCHLVVDYTEKHICVANYMGKTFCTFMIENGVISPTPIQVIKHEGKGPHKNQDSSHAHMFALSPNHEFAFLCDLGLDKIYQYVYDAETGKLTVNPNGEYLEVDPGSGPRHITFHPNGKYAYVINELNSTMLVCDYDYLTGILSKPKQKISTIPENISTENCAGAEIEVTSDGKFVYVSNRGDSDSIAIFRLDDQGTVKLVGHQETEKFPRHFALFDNFMIVANQNSNTIQVFRRDIHSGQLQQVSRIEGIEKPVCVLPFV